MPLRSDIKKVLVIGSGPIIIGQADEFDYAGLLGKVKSTFGMLWSFKNYNNVEKMIKEEK